MAARCLVDWLIRQRQFHRRMACVESFWDDPATCAIKHVDKTDKQVAARCRVDCLSDLANSIGVWPVWTLKIVQPSGFLPATVPKDVSQVMLTLIQYTVITLIVSISSFWVVIIETSLWTWNSHDLLYEASPRPDHDPFPRLRSHPAGCRWERPNDSWDRFGYWPGVRKPYCEAWAQVFLLCPLTTELTLVNLEFLFHGRPLHIAYWSR